MGWTGYFPHRAGLSRASICGIDRILWSRLSTRFTERMLQADPVVVSGKTDTDGQVCCYPEFASAYYRVRAAAVEAWRESTVRVSLQPSTRA